MSYPNSTSTSYNHLRIITLSEPITRNSLRVSAHITTDYLRCSSTNFIHISTGSVTNISKIITNIKIGFVTIRHNLESVELATIINGQIVNVNILLLQDANLDTQELVISELCIDEILLYVKPEYRNQISELLKTLEKTNIILAISLDEAWTILFNESCLLC